MILNCLNTNTKNVIEKAIAVKIKQIPDNILKGFLTLLISSSFSFIIDIHTDFQDYSIANQHQHLRQILTQFLPQKTLLLIKNLM